MRRRQFSVAFHNHSAACEQWRQSIASPDVSIDQGDGRLAVTVRDTGIGIAPGDMDTVRTPFGQVESVFSRKYHGTGLGLPLANSLAVLHGGSLTIESTKGAGTAVTVLLPASRVVATFPKTALLA